MGYNSNFNSHATTAASGGGISITGLLQVAFIVLKLCHVINWSWFWVLFPTILGIGLLLLCFILMGMIALGDASQNKKLKKQMEQVKKTQIEWEQIAAKQKLQEEQRLREKQITEGITYTLGYEDFQKPNFPKLNEWLLKKKFEFQLSYKYEFRNTTILVGDVVPVSFRRKVSIVFYNSKYEGQEKQISLGVDDVVRIFPSNEKINTLEIITPSKLGVGPQLYTEEEIRVLVFEKNE